MSKESDMFNDDSEISSNLNFILCLTKIQRSQTVWYYRSEIYKTFSISDKQVFFVAYCVGYLNNILID